MVTEASPGFAQQTGLRRASGESAQILLVLVAARVPWVSGVLVDFRLCSAVMLGGTISRQSRYLFTPGCGRNTLHSAAVATQRSCGGARRCEVGQQPEPVIPAVHGPDATNVRVWPPTRRT